MSPGLLKSLVILRYVVLVAFAGWAGAAAALGKWGLMMGFFAYMALLYFLGKSADRHHGKQ